MSAKMKPKPVAPKKPEAVQIANDRLKEAFQLMEKVGSTIAETHRVLGLQYAALETAHDKLLADNEKLFKERENLRDEIELLEAELKKAREALKTAKPAPEPRRKFDPEHAVTEVVTITNVHVSQDGTNVGFAVTDMGADVYIPSHLMAKIERDASGLKGDRVRLTIIPNERTDYRAVRYLGTVE